LVGAEVASPGVDPTLFGPREPHPWRWRLLYCGRPDPRKGVATAIEALPHLPPEATLVIHGDGDRAFLETLRTLAHRLGVGERVRFQHSDHERVPGVYAQADAVVFPAIWREPWGLVPLEAMAVGRPVLASRAGGGPSEYLEDGRNCLQFAAGDAVQLARALQRLASAPRLRTQIIAAGHATAARFTQDEFHARILDELDRLTEPRENHRGRV
jgi:glycosyltransferase involved in cell wall biosynthesis